MHSKRRSHALGAVVPFTVLALALALPGAAAGVARASDETTGKGAGGAGSVTISDAWARATPAGARMGSVYLRLVSENGDRLLGASLPRSVTSATEIHETVVRHDPNGGPDSMEMHPVSSLELPPHEPVELKPGGYHLMLMRLKRPLKAGDSVRVTLRFEKAGTRTVMAEVREL